MGKKEIALKFFVIAFLLCFLFSPLVSSTVSAASNDGSFDGEVSGIFSTGIHEIVETTKYVGSATFKYSSSLSASFFSSIKEAIINFFKPASPEIPAEIENQNTSSNVVSYGSAQLPVGSFVTHDELARALSVINQSIGRTIYSSPDNTYETYNNTYVTNQSSSGNSREGLARSVSERTTELSREVSALRSEVENLSVVSLASTDVLPEGLSNLYYTDTRADARFAFNFGATTTDALAEGISNLYYNDSYVADYLSASSTLRNSINYWQYDEGQGLLSYEGTTTITGTFTVAGNTYITNAGELTVGDKIIAPGEIGLGTSTPAAKLAVQNTIADQTAFLIYGTSSSQTAPLVDIFDNPNDNNNLFRIAANGDVKVGTLNGIIYGTDGVLGAISTSTLASSLNYWSKSGSDIFYTGGNVGIGKTDPYSLLSFPAALGHKISLYDGALQTYGFGIQPNQLQIYTQPSSGHIALGSGSSESFTNLFDVSYLGGVGIGTYAGVQTAPINGLIVPGNVGIGTTTPESKLSVIGDTYLEGNVVATGGVVVSATNNIASGKDYFIKNPSGTGIGTASGGVGASALVGWSGVTSIFAGGASFFNVGGAMPIGWTPGGNAADAQGADVALSRLSSGKLALGNGSLGDYSGTFVAGNVGIGTTTPSEKLTINGTILSNPDGQSWLFGATEALIRTPLVGIGTASGGYGYSSLFFSANNQNSALLSTDSFHIKNDMTFGWSPSPTGAGPTTRISRLSDGVVSIDTGTAGDSLGTLIANSIGVGTTNPTRRLEVQTTGDNVYPIWMETSGTGVFLGVKDSTGESSFGRYASSTYFETNTGSDIDFLEFGESRIKIKSGGNVGIGTTDPGAKTEIYQSNTDYTNTLGANSHLMLNNPSATGQNSVSSVINGTLVAKWRSDYLGDSILTAYGGDHYFYTGSDAAGVPKMIIKNGGNIGINASDPQSKLDIGGGVSVGSYAGNNTAPSNGLIVSGNVGIGTVSPSAKLSIVGTAGSDPVFAVASSSTDSLFQINANGKVGVGTAAPQQSFHVQDANGGYFMINALDGSLEFASGNDPQTYMDFKGNSNLGGDFQGRISHTDGAGFDFFTNANGADSVLRIGSNGNVGIGTNDPQYMLHVVGDDGAGNVAKFETGSGGTSCTLNGSTGLLNCSSDERLKKDIESLNSTSTLDHILELNPVSYHWKTDDGAAVLKYGFIAQQVEGVFPELVSTDGVTGFKALSLNGMVPFIVSAVQELAHKVTNISKWFSNDGDKLQVEGEICVDDFCVTKDEFKSLIQGAEGNVSHDDENDNEEGISDDDSSEVDSAEDEAPADEVIEEDLENPVEEGGESEVEEPLLEESSSGEESSDSSNDSSDVTSEGASE